MKKISLYLSLLLGVLLFSCKKTENLNPLSDFKNLGVGVYITKTTTINVNFVYNTASSKVGITVDQYGGDVDKVDLFVVAGADADPAHWKKIKTITYSGAGTEISATESEMATALGTTPDQLSPGNYYTFYNRVITKDGRTFDVSNTPGALESNPNYNAVFRWTAYITCPFTGGMAGFYKVLQDDWADWSPGDIVSVLDGPGANQVNLSKVWPNIAYGDVINPLTVDVAPATGVATVKSQNWGDYGPGYSMVAVGANDAGVAGYIFSCTGFITLNMTLTTVTGSKFGNNKLILQKQ